MQRVRLKFCGMTNKPDVDKAIELGADAIGIILYEKSKRYVSLDKACELLKVIPAFVDSVAVMVNPDREFVSKAIESLPIQYLQFHGDEPVEFCESFSLPYIKAIRARTSAEIIKAVQTYHSASAILLDTPVDGEYGGSGIAFDWQLIPDTIGKPYILAGGLNPSNIKQASKSLYPYAVDVCSGVEASDGIKDYNKMTEFAKAVRDNYDR